MQELAETQLNTKTPSCTNSVEMPEWLQEKIMADIKAAYAYSVEHAAKIPEQGFKALEDGLREKMRGISSRLLQAGLERGVGKGYAGSRIACDCGRSKRYVEDRDKVITTWFGEIRVRRAYYHCRECRIGKFPIDEILGIGGASFSPAVREAICMTDAEIPFERGQKFLEKLSGIRVSVEEGRLIAEAKGRELEKQAQDEIEHVWQPRKPKPRERTEAPERLYVSPDGTHVPIRMEKDWKEVKVGTVFSTKIPTKGEEPVRENTRYVAGLENAETFYKRLYVEGLKQRIDEAKEVIVIGDGAEWIWNQAELTLPKNRVEIIDYYHATEKLWALGRCVWGQESEQARRWAGRWSEKLYAGKVKHVIAAMKRIKTRSKAARELKRTTIGYFATNKERMEYAKLRRKGYFIGSGVTESSCKHLVGTRLKQCGMRWDKKQAQAILQLRLARLNNRWDYLWN